MFTSMYNGLNLKPKSENSLNTKVSLKTVDITRQNIEIFLSQFYKVDTNIVIDTDDKSASALKYSFKLLLVLDKHLDWLIDLNIEDNFNSISAHQYSKETIKQVPVFTNKNILDKINVLHCLFTWNLQTIPSKRDMISHIKKKYGNYNLDISLPKFSFERYITNIIIGYELFIKGKKETAKLVLLLIGKWLEELDQSSDDFYLLISDGLKYVLKSTFAHMMITNLSKCIQLMDSIIPFSDISYNSKAAVYAIQAAVLIEYGSNEDCFKNAVECVNLACDLDPTVSYWFYLHSLVLTAHRRFLLTYKSCPTENEKSTIQQAILLSDVQNMYIQYHEITLFKDIFFYNFHKNKNKFKNDKQLCEEKHIVLMIKKLVSLEPTDPLILIYCAKVLRTLPTIVRDLNFEKQLLLKGLQMAPNDLIVLKAVTAHIIIHFKKNIKNDISNEDQHTKINNQTNLVDDLKIATEKHNMGIDPIQYLISVLDNYDYLTQWKILAQICSYTILFNEDLKSGVKIFMMLVEAEENEMIPSDLILRHYSSFVNKSKKFNLAELISEEIKIALDDNIDLHEKQYYKKILNEIVSIYDIEIDVNKSIRSYLISKPRNRKFQPKRSKNKNKARNSGNHQNIVKRISYVNHDVDTDNLIADNTNDTNEDDSSYVDCSSDDDNQNNNDNCCLCRLM